MSRNRFFLDTAFAQAVIDRRDQYHNRAMKYADLLNSATLVVVTELVLAEIGDALSVVNRGAAVEFIDQCYSSENITVVSVDTSLFRRGLLLYRNRPDRGWGLTDCVSFVVMQDAGLSDALTSDRHLSQAGFQALLLN